MSSPEVNVLSAGSVEPGLRHAAEAFFAASGCRVSLDWATTPNIRRRLGAGEVFDLSILTAEAARDLTQDGILRPEVHVPIGAVGVGVAVRQGAAAPVVERPEDIRKALFDADSVIFTLATSGLYIESMLKREGLYDALLPRITRFETGPQMMDHLIHSRGNVVCLGAAVELAMFHDKGICHVGPLPEPMQFRTAYVAARTAKGKDAENAGAFARYLSSSDGRRMLAACGVDVECG